MTSEVTDKLQKFPLYNAKVTLYINSCTGDTVKEIHSPEKKSIVHFNSYNYASYNVFSLYYRNVENPSTQRLLQQTGKGRVKPRNHGWLHKRDVTFAPSTSPTASPSSSPKPSSSNHQSPSPSPSPSPSSYSHLPVGHESPAPAPSPGNAETGQSTYITVGVGAFALFSLSSVFFICCRTIKVDATIPWKTGLSGKLQKALVTGQLHS